ncbi:MAG: hypothetical protein K2Z81_06405, partial [Cyanobacteria bacterium]|nr:hypothetical protein [Cyanobacteriota bacterium]
MKVVHLIEAKPRRRYIGKASMTKLSIVEVYNVSDYGWNHADHSDTSLKQVRPRLLTKRYSMITRTQILAGVISLGLKACHGRVFKQSKLVSSTILPALVLVSMLCVYLCPAAN